MKIILFRRVGLATIGVCVFCAATSVAALFVLGGLFVSLNPTERNKVILINPKEISEALDSVALAYKDYPMFNYVFGNNGNIEPIKQIYKSSVTTSDFICLGVKVDGDYQAVAIFAKPNYKGVPTLQFLMNGGIKLLLKHSFGMAIRLLNYENNAMKVKSKYSNSNCWYLYSLTVHPDHQHKGLGSKVMQPMLDFFDATGQSCYLETNKDDNIAMYEHFGFELMEKGYIPKTNVVHYAMRREPMNR